MKTLRSLCWLIVFSLIFSLAIAGETADERIKQGQKLFQEKNFTAALQEFQEAEKLAPDQPLVYSWMAACLNTLKRYPEAKEKAEKALNLVLSQPSLLLSNPGALDIGYYSLLAEIKTHLHDFEGAVKTINEYPIPEGWRTNRKQETEKVDAAKSSLQKKMLLAGLECLSSHDLVCARKAIEQAGILQPLSPAVLLSLAKEALAQADKAPAATDEEKTLKIDLYRMTADLISRLPEPELAKPEAQRILARALSGEKGPENYQKAIKILTSLWDGSAAQDKQDSSILLDLAAVYASGEDWDLVLKTTSDFIQRSPNSPGGQAYCSRSFANYRLGQYEKAVEDGSKCTNPDGTPRQFKYLDVCRQELAAQKAAADKSVAASNDGLRNSCNQLKANADWVLLNPDASMTDLVPLIGNFEAGKLRCKDYVGTTDTAELCQAVVKTASNPLNLSLKSAAELNELYTFTRKFSEICGKHLNETQKAAIVKALKLLTDKLATPQ